MSDPYNLEIVHCTYLGSSGYNLKNCILLAVDLFFTFIKSVDPDEMQHYLAGLMADVVYKVSPEFSRFS